MLANQALNYLVSGKSPKRMGNAHPNIVPYQVLPVADGHIIIAVGNDGQFRRLCGVLGVPGLAEHDSTTSAMRCGSRTGSELIGLLAERTMQFKRDDLLAALEKVGVPAGPINTVADVFEDPQVRARGMRVDLPAPSVAGGSVPTVRIAADAGWRGDGRRKCPATAGRAYRRGTGGPGLDGQNR